MKTTDKIKKYLEHGLCVRVEDKFGDSRVLYPYDRDLTFKYVEKIIKAYHYKDYKPYEVGQKVEWEGEEDTIIQSINRNSYRLNKHAGAFHHTELIPVFEEEKEEQFDLKALKEMVKAVNNFIYKSENI